MKKFIFCLMAIVLIAASCNNKKTAVYTDRTTAVVLGTNGKINTVGNGQIIDKNSKLGIIPKASVFTMSGDFANNVAITIDNNGKIIYFPAPTDLSSASKPISVGNGWWLNCQGISDNSVFTTYTFDEYMNLDKVPTVEQLKAAIIPGAKVVKMTSLPWTLNEARGNINKVEEYINSNNL